MSYVDRNDSMCRLFVLTIHLLYGVKKTLKCAHSAGEREREGEGGREGGREERKEGGREGGRKRYSWEKEGEKDSLRDGR